MALSQFVIQLFVDESQGPPFYWLVTTSTFAAEDMLIGNGNEEFSSSNGPEQEIELTLNVASTNGQPPAQTNIQHLVELGEVEFHSVKITLQGPNGGITTGTVLSEDAEQETRPWP
jgi:hypothetical protein